MKKKTKVMLSISSILMILGGLTNLIVSFVGVRMGTAIISTAGSNVFTAIFGILIIFFSLLTGAVILLAGILGVIGKKIELCQRLSFIAIALVIMHFGTLFEVGRFEWYTIFNLVFPMFYCFAVWMARKDLGIKFTKKAKKV